MLPQDYIDARAGHVFAEHVTIQAENGSLEGWLAYDADRTISDGVVLLSPHPNFAGTMDNNVIKELAAYLSAAGYAALRFNYPGVGASSIALPEGVSAFDYWDTVEKEQRFREAIRPATSALDFLRNSLGECIDEIHLVGYSYGGMIAMMIAGNMSHISSATAISLPWISRYNYDFLQDVDCPKLFISGKHDFTFDADIYQRVWPKISEPKIFKSADNDHFFRKSERELARHISDFLASLKKSGDFPGK
jgi:alpha/beta superfamily hydrolase